jgi:hypothetical protein
MAPTQVAQEKLPAHVYGNRKITYNALARHVDRYLSSGHATRENCRALADYLGVMAEDESLPEF